MYLRAWCYITAQPYLRHLLRQDRLVTVGAARVSHALESFCVKQKAACHVILGFLLNCSSASNGEERGWEEDSQNTEGEG